MTKLFPFFMLLVGFSAFPVQAGAAETAVSSTPLKTGEYRVCRGTEAECLQGKGETGKVSVRFEKNGAGRFAAKDTEEPFGWEQQGNAILITPSDGKPYKLEVKAGSTLLRESNEMSYLIIEDEDTVFRTGMYYRCSENTEAACLKGAEAFVEELSSEEDAPAEFLRFSEENSELLFCPKNKPGCDTLVWKRASSGGELDALNASGQVVLRFTEDRNMLVERSTGARYLRVMSEAVMQSAN